MDCSGLGHTAIAPAVRRRAVAAVLLLALLRVPAVAPAEPSAVSGAPAAELDKIAPAVDRVIGEQVDRLVAFAEGRPR